MVRSRIYDAIHLCSNRDKMVISRKMICAIAKVSSGLLCTYEKNDPVLKAEITAILPLSPDQEINRALHKLFKTKQMPSIDVLVRETGLSSKTINDRLAANKSLQEQFSNAKRIIECMRRSITLDMR